jgi:hypothetical protein
MESQQQVFLILNISTVYLATKQGREKAPISLGISLGVAAEQYAAIKVPFGQPNARGFHC